ncbi:hypothetical protein [Phenylobacterium sp.]|uniref:hypothetical protein n=1 Tax=Phenylobacterium sp. TaxID=1871053 RepID=UPI0025E237EA|nr:hypothetical protein [Phenylobacterium sp.]
MRIGLLLAMALTLGACDHMYGAFDGGRLAARSGPTEQELVAIAAKRLAREKWSVDQMNVGVSDAGHSWRVHFRPADASVLDGGGWVDISKATRRAVRVGFDA